MENKLVDFGSVHPDVKRYLDHDCYCPGEIYDFTGIWTMILTAWKNLLANAFMMLWENSLSAKRINGLLSKKSVQMQMNSTMMEI